MTESQTHLSTTPNHAGRWRRRLAQAKTLVAGSLTALALVAIAVPASASATGTYYSFSDGASADLDVICDSRPSAYTLTFKEAASTTGIYSKTQTARSWKQANGTWGAWQWSPASGWTTHSSSDSWFVMPTSNKVRIAVYAQFGRYVRGIWTTLPWYNMDHWTVTGTPVGTIGSISFLNWSARSTSCSFDY